MMSLLKYIKSFFAEMFCPCEDNERIVFYQETCNWTPVIKVWQQDTCRRCGRISSQILAEYPSCYYDFAEVKSKLEEKGIRELMDISLEGADKNE